MPMYSGAITGGGSVEVDAVSELEGVVALGWVEGGFRRLSELVVDE